MSEVIMFGGSPAWTTILKTGADFIRQASTTVLVFEKKDYPTTLGRHIAPTREWVLTDVVDKSQLEDRERVREKLRKLSQLSHEVQRRFKESEMRARRSTFEAETARRSALRLRHQEEVALRLKLH